MRTLDRKILRDVVHLRGQLAAIVVLVACGVAVFVALRAMHGYLRDRQQAYYAEYRFPHVFATVKRAPETLRGAIERVPGVATADLRIVEDVLLDVPGLAEPATGRLVSLPDAGRPALNDVHLRRGRLPEPGRRDEVLASDAFARANGLRPGDTVGAILKGRWERLRIVGTAIAPEFIYEIRGAGSLFPDNRRFGALWMRRRALEAAFDMEGAFNDVLARLRRGASEGDAIAALDRLLERYGSVGAYGREDHASHEFISAEIEETQVTSVLFPAIFLGVTAFLLHTLLSRLVAMEREQIGTLKAFGFDDRAIAAHYLKLALLPVAVGAAIGTALGLFLAVRLAGIYARFFQFPEVGYDPDARLALLAVGIALAAGAAGALGAVRRAVAVPPAVAMRPEAPPRFTRSVLERTPLWRRIGPAGRIVLRNIARARGKAALAVLGIAVALGLVASLLSLFDAIDRIADNQFRRVQRDDIAVVFAEPKPGRAARELGRLPGVRRAEPFRAVAARLRARHREERTSVLGLAPGGALRRLVDAEGRAHELPARGGLVLGRMLAERLGVGAGDDVRVEVMEEKRPARTLPVEGVVDTLIGLEAYATVDALNDLLGEADAISGAWLAVDEDARERVYARLKRLPGVGAATVREATLESFERTVAESFEISLATTVAFACALVLGIVYNGARIALSARGRELASLRVLGFSKREVAAMLLGEQALLTLAAVPLGLGIGYGLCALVAWRFQTALFRLPIVFRPRTIVVAVGVVLAAAAVSAWLVRRRVERLDLIAVLKTRE